MTVREAAVVVHSCVSFCDQHVSFGDMLYAAFNNTDTELEEVLQQETR